MFQEIEPHVLNNEYKDILPKSSDYLVVVRGQKVLASISEGKVTLPRVSDIFKDGVNEGELIYLLSLDDRGIFLYGDFEKEVMLSGYDYVEKFAFRGTEPNELAFAASVSFHLGSFYENNRFCGRCGSPYGHSHKERALVCDKCGQHLYPRINPAMIVGIVDGDRLLLSKYSDGYYRKYALIAGYAEIGETIEECVKREVMEETGLKVKNIRYFTSQPWPFSQSLLLGFFADLDGSDKVTIDENELSCAEWFKREEIEMDDSTLSMTKTMIKYFKDHPERF